MFPELVTGREDDCEIGPWTLLPGSTARGEASCNLGERILQVPLGRDATSRVVRAHELLHIRISPIFRDNDIWFGALAPRAIECAEELRVNALLSRLGFAAELLRDGSEKFGAQRIGEADDWSEAVCFLMAVVGTGSERDFLAGIRRVRPTWLPGLRALRKRALQLLATFDTQQLGSTRRNAEGLASGFGNFSVVLATIMTQSMAARPPVTPDEVRRFRRSLEPGGRRPATGRFAQLRFDDTLEMSPRARGRGQRKARPGVSGTVMRYPGRLLTDPQQRAFAQRRSVHGGIVVVDQSGSMDIDVGAMTSLLQLAPDAMVIGYSHRPGSRDVTANAWVLADRGTVAQKCPPGNVGNGVDGPVLEWAISKRRGAEPIVWVTDGQVTDSHDHPDEELTSYCATLVLRHEIRLVGSLSDCERFLGRRGIVESTNWNSFGRTGRKVLEMKG